MRGATARLYSVQTAASIAWLGVEPELDGVETRVVTAAEDEPDLVDTLRAP